MQRKTFSAPSVLYIFRGIEDAAQIANAICRMYCNDAVAKRIPQKWFAKLENDIWILENTLFWSPEFGDGYLRRPSKEGGKETL